MSRPDPVGRARARLLSAAGRAEQEIRAYPRVHAAFYAAIGHSPVLRDLVGRTKDGVRTSTGASLPEIRLPDSPLSRARRRQAVAARLATRSS